MLDEFVHHGAEVALLRDLWRWQHPVVAGEPLVERVVRGDMAVLDDIDGPPDGELVGHAARYARWDLVIALVERGAAIPSTGRTPLHLAAGAGEVAAVQALLDHGADPTARDPEFHATPRQWADFLHHPTVAALLVPHDPRDP